MSFTDTNKGGAKLPTGKGIAQNAVDSSGLAEKATQKLNEAAAPVTEAVSKAQETASKAKQTVTQAQEGLSKAKNIMGSTTGFNPTSGSLSNFSITPSEVLEKESLKSSLTRYGGDLSSLLGDSHLIFATIQIGGEEVLKESNYQLQIQQNTADHDSFQLRCPSEAFGESDTYPLSQTGNYLGKKMTAQFKQFGKTTSIFTGIITNITSRKQDGYPYIILSGQSPTILLENGLDCQSYEEKNLKQIIESATKEYNGLIEWDIRPQMEQELLYTVQYRESDWQFIKRLATRYGEWLYWDGQKVVFGGFGGKTVELQEGQDISRYELKMQLVPQKFTYLSYDAKQAENYNVNSDSISIEPSVNPFQQKAVKASEETFSKVPSSLYNQSLMEKGETELKEAVKRQKQSRQNVFYLEADSDNPEIRIGDIVKLKAYMPGNEIFKKGDVPLESYRIMNISHRYDPSEGYQNTFTAIPKDNFTPPYMNEDAVPECEEQSATVTDNNDPEGLSRIRVQFPWQKIAGGESPWLRVVTPYAGEGKGMHIIPEIGEEVIVSFENGNAEKPVVLGAMFNGSGKSGHGKAGNYMKGLRTASGCNLTFNDKLGSMNLADKGLSSMKFDGSGNSAIATATTQAIAVGGSEEAPAGQANLLMDNEGNITLEGKTKIVLKVGENTITLTADGITADASAANIKIIGNRTEIGKAGAEQGMLVNESGNTYVNGDDKITITAANAKVVGDGTIRIDSPDTDIT